jgi:hypothetical protein
MFRDDIYAIVIAILYLNPGKKILVSIRKNSCSLLSVILTAEETAVTACLGVFIDVTRQ